jgi:type I restriction enzyme S subunit
MASEWRDTALSELCVITRGASPRPIHDWLSPTGTPWVKISDATQSASRVISSTAEKIRTEGARHSVVVHPGDFILSNSATPGLPKFMGIEACIHDGWLLLRDFNGLDKLFAYYLLLNDRPHLVHQGNGSVFTNLKTDILKSHRVHLPPLPEQRAIAHILGTLDDKIDLNRQMSATLEAMARALFESWFVRFDPVRAKAEGRDTGLPAEIADLFPDRFEASEIGEVPKGWRTVALEDLADVEKGLSYKGAHLEDSGGIPMITLGCFAGSGAFKAQGLKRYSGKHEAKHMVRAGDLLVANTDITQDRVVLGSPVIVPESISGGSTLFTHHVFAVRTRQPLMRRFLFFALLQRDFRDTAKGHATGTTVLALPRNSVSKHRLCLPDAQLLEWAMAQMTSFSLRAERQRVESDSLRSLRDTLLPKLISGDLRVPDAERVLADAGV